MEFGFWKTATAVKKNRTDRQIDRWMGGWMDGWIAGYIDR